MSGWKSGVVWAGCVVAAWCQGATLRVTPNDAGGLEAKLQADPTVREVVFEGGTYHCGISLAPLKGVDPAAHPLLLRPAEGAEVVFDGADRSMPLDRAQPVEGQPGVYAIAYNPAGNECPKLWEPAARVRYRQVADARSVARYRATYATDGSRLFFQTTDGTAPAAGRVMINHAYLDYGLFITRPHVTVRGLKFRNYLVRAKYSTGVQARADGVTVEDCEAANCSTGFTIVKHGCVLRRCRVEDCGCGVYVDGNDGVVEECRFLKRRDAFMVPMYEQDDSGIQYYHPARNGALRGNVVQGFARGVTLKCEGIFRVEHNTVVDCHEGILRTVPQVGDRYERNLIVGCGAPGLGGRLLRPGVVNDGNVFWDALNPEELLAVLEAARLIGSGGGNVMADPRFVDRAGGDLRLMPGSVCAALAGNGRPVGALGVVPGDFQDRQPPVVRIQLRMPAFPSGAVGRVSFERDAWIGGGTTFIREERRPDPEADYDTTELDLPVEIEALDAGGRPEKMALRLNDAAWSGPEPYARRKQVRLPDRTGVHVLAVRVADEVGNWSAPVSARIRLTRDVPTVAGEPVVYANDHGVVVSFRTTAPAFARVEYSPDQTFALSQEEPQRTLRRWNSNDGGDWVTRWREPSTAHHVALIAPAVKKGATYRYRIALEDSVGRKTQSAAWSFTVGGAARTWVVDPAGEDADARGAEAKPVKSFQFAVDRALPGDRVVVRPGVYGGDTLLMHGGVEGAPITLEAAKRGEAVLDSARETYCLLRLDGASHVVVRDFVMRSYAQDGAGVYVADSSDVTIEGCSISNWLPGEGWPFGQGIFAHRSPGLTARGNVVHRQENGIFLLVSPRATIVNNTAFRNLYKGLAMHFSCGGTKVLNNSFTYNTSDQMGVDDPESTEALKSMTCDYNNLAAWIEPMEPGEVVSNARSEDPTVRKRAEPSKAIVWALGKRFRDIGAWRKAYGWEAHGVFADPRYVDPTGGDFRLKPGSPNVGAGKDGVTIGALGVAE